MTVLDYSNANLSSCFFINGLSWTSSIEKVLGDLSIVSIVEIHLTKPEEWNNMFTDQKPIKQQKAQKIYTEIFARKQH